MVWTLIPNEGRGRGRPLDITLARIIGRGTGRKVLAIPASHFGPSDKAVNVYIANDRSALRLVPTTDYTGYSLGRPKKTHVVHVNFNKHLLGQVSWPVGTQFTVEPDGDGAIILRPIDK